MVRLEHTLVMVSKNCGSDIVLFVRCRLNRERYEVDMEQGMLWL